MKKVLISTSTFAEFDRKPLELIRDAGFEIEANPYGRTLTIDESKTLYRNKIGVIAGTEKISRELIDVSPELKVLSRLGTGMENIDREYAETRGIAVFNTPDGPTRSVAELTLGLILSLLRHICVSDRDMRQGVWKKRMGKLIEGKTVGIIGYGKIGQCLGEMLRPLGSRVIFHDCRELKARQGCEPCSFHELIENADVVCIHVSGDFRKGPLIGASELSVMKKGAYLINCSRGGAVDENALFTVLNDGHLAGAALDVFESEPYRGQLGNLPNVVMTPHIGSYAQEARVAMEYAAAENLLMGLGVGRFGS